MNLHEINEKSKLARQNYFIFNQIKNTEKKFFSKLSNKYLCYYSKLPIPSMHGKFFKKLSRKPEQVKSVCFDRNNLFHFVCGMWSLYKQSN